MIELNPVSVWVSIRDRAESGFGQVTGLQHVIELNPGCRSATRDRADSGFGQVTGLQHVIGLNPGCRAATCDCAESGFRSELPDVVF